MIGIPDHSAECPRHQHGGGHLRGEVVDTGQPERQDDAVQTRRTLHPLLLLLLPKLLLPKRHLVGVVVVLPLAGDYVLDKALERATISEEGSGERRVSLQERFE